MASYTCILASRPGGALYTGSTDDLRTRMEQHRSGAIGGHTKICKIHTLVWIEPHATRGDALTRERSIKRWRRAWKDQLIMAANPDWCDVARDVPLWPRFGGPGSSSGKGTQ